MASEFRDKIYLITGAGRGIGRAIAENLANNGAKVFALDLIKENLDDLVVKVPNIVAVSQDLRNWDETVETVEKLGDFDGLVNCAGVAVRQSMMEVSKKQLDEHYAVNLNAPINLMQVVGMKMKARGNGGSIVNISSIGSKGALAGSLGYNVSKAGLDMATKMFALELGPHKIRVNSVNPSLIPTDMTIPHISELGFQQIVNKTPLRRQLEKQHVVDLVMFLLSDRSALITGTTHVIDGGLTCQLP